MVTNDAYEELTRKLLAETMSEAQVLRSEILERQERLVALEAEASAYELALQGYLRRTGRFIAGEPEWDVLLSGHTHKEKLIRIAEQAGGRISVSKATDLLYSRGFIKSKKRSTAYSMVQHLLIDLSEDGKFEKLTPGEYRLIGVQETLPLG